MSGVMVALIYLALLGAIAIYDLRTLRAPNRFVYPLIGFAAVASLTVFRVHAGEALLGGVLAFGALLLVAVIGRGAMGFGDVKYGLACGIVVGVHGVLAMLVCSFALSGIVAAVVL